MDIIRKTYHKLSDFRIVRAMGECYWNGSRLGEYIARKRIQRVCKEMAFESRNVLTIIFLCQDVKMWSKIESIYEQMKIEKRFSTYLIAITDITDVHGNETYEILKKKYPEVIDYKTNEKVFDLKSLHPNYVFYQKPYDQYLPKEYRSKIVSKYAKICYCAYAAILTKGGLVHSCNNRFLRNCYMYFAENEFMRAYNEHKMKKSCEQGIRKFIFAGYPILDKFSEIAPKKETHKTILWTPRWSADKEIGGSNFLGYKDQIVDYVKENNNIRLVFRPHPLLFYHFISTNEISKEEAAEYKEIYKNTDRLTLDESADYYNTFMQTDILVSDISSMILEWYITGKPIIYCETGAEINEVMTKALKGCYIAKNWEEVKEITNSLIVGEDPLNKTRDEVCKMLYDEKIGDSTKNIVKCIELDFWGQE